MSTIRRQSIVSSLIVYFGFALGLFNTYLFTRQGGFTEAQYGLTNTFIAIASIMFAVAGMGMPGYIAKFFPYYKAHLPQKKNDQISWALLLSCLGFLIVMALGFVFRGWIFRMYENAPQLPRYYYWIFPFGFGFTLFYVLEAYAWQQQRAVLSNFLKEVLFRAFVTVLIVLTTFGIIDDFDIFIRIYAFLYLVLAIALLLFLYSRKELSFHFRVSRVSRRFYRKIRTLVAFVWGGGLVFNVANVFDGIVIAAVLPDGLTAAGIFYLAQNISSLMQAPQRAVISAAIGPLSQAWKDKDYGKINRIYGRSAINQLLFAAAMFCLIWLNFTDGVRTFGLRETYLQAQWVFFFLGISRIIDMGTGLNSQIIGTSTHWRFEFISGLILLALTLPLNWLLTRYYGVVGPAYSNLISFTVYNAIRFGFLWKNFRMQPFSWKTLHTLVLAAACFLISYLLFRDGEGIVWILARSLTFIALYGTGAVLLKLSPDIGPVWGTVKKRLGFGR
jgi:O-antigen/teichoic acid export membrane protein